MFLTDQKFLNPLDPFTVVDLREHFLCVSNGFCHLFWNFVSALFFVALGMVAQGLNGQEFRIFLSHSSESRKHHKSFTFDTKF